MKRVLFLPADFYPSNTGFSNATRSLIEALREYCPEVDIHIFTTVPLGSKKELQGAKVVRYQETKWRTKPFTVLAKLLKYRFLKQYVSNNGIDFIMLETNTFTFLQSLLLRKFKKKLAVRIHSTADTEFLVFKQSRGFFEKLQKLADCSFMNEVRFIISTNNYHSDFIKKHFFKENVYRIWEDKDYFILPNTISHDQIGQIKADLIGDYLLTMGKLSSNGYIQKGIQDLLKAIYVLKIEERLPKTLKLKVVGDGEMWNNLVLLARQLGIQESIDFIKETTQLETFQLLASSRAVILLSRYEGQSMFATEALAIGKPLIITNDNGMRDMINDGTNGFSVVGGDYLGAAKAIQRIYDMDSEALRDMGQKSLSIYNEKFHPREVARAFTRIVNIVCAQNS